MSVTLKAKEQEVLRVIYQLEETGRPVRPIEVARHFGYTLTSRLHDQINGLIDKGMIKKARLNGSFVTLSCTPPGRSRAERLRGVMLHDYSSTKRSGLPCMIPKDMPGLADRSKPFGLIVSDKVYARIMDGVDYSRDERRPRDADGYVPARGLAHSGCSSSLDGGA